MVRTANQDNIAPAASVAATGTAPRNKLLTAKRQATVPSVARFYRDDDFIDEHRGSRAILQTRSSRTCRGGRGRGIR